MESLITIATYIYMESLITIIIIIMESLITIATSERYGFNRVVNQCFRTIALKEHAYLIGMQYT